jgi:hypothetical protein
VSTKKYNPFDLDKPVLNLGEHGEFTLGEVTKSRHSKCNKILNELAEIESSLYEEMIRGIADDGDEDASDASKVDMDDLSDRQVHLIAELCEVSCENSEGLKDKIVGLYDSEAIGRLALKGCYQFVVEWVRGESAAGEG